MRSILFLGNYDVYEDGRIYSHYRNRFLTIQHNRNGYCYVTLYENGKSKMYFVHRAVAICYLPNPNSYPHINHIDGNKDNNHWSNLEWCTPLYNNIHARKTGLNNISESDSMRWNDPAFRAKTSMAISCAHKGLHADSRNPSNRYTPYINNREVTRKELGDILGIAQNTVKQYIYDAAHGKKCGLFEKHNVQVRETEKSQSTIESIA